MSNSTNTFFFVLFVLVSFFTNTTASLPRWSIELQDKCDTVFSDGLIECLDYLGTGVYQRRHDNPSSSCCSVVRNAWNVYPICVNVNILGEFMFSCYFGYDTDITRVAQVTSACGIVDGSRKPSARPPVAASPLEARPPVTASPLEARSPVAASPLSLA